MANTDPITVPVTVDKTNFKFIYQTFNTAQSNGSFFMVLVAPKDYPTAYPYTEKTVPDALKDKVAYFDWNQPGNGAWIDVSDDAQKAQLAALQKANADLNTQLSQSAFAQMTTEQDLTTAQQTIADQGKQLKTVTDQLAAASYQLMTMGAGDDASTKDDKDAKDTTANAGK